MEKKILFIAYLYPPVGGKGLPGVQRSVKFIRYLSGVQKIVLTLQEKLYPEFFPLNNTVPLPINREKVVRTGTLDLFGVMLNARALISSVLKKGHTPDPQQGVANIKRPDQGPSEKSVFSAIKDFVSDMLTVPDYAYAWILPAVWKGKGLVGPNDVIFATGMPWSSLVVGWLIKLLTGSKLIVDFRDPWEGNLFASEKVNLRIAIERWLERRVIKDADMVLLNTEALREDFLIRYPHLPRKKFMALPNGFDSNDFTQVPLEKPRAASDGICLTHTGYLYGVRDPKPIFKAIQKIRESQPQTASKIKFKQVGYADLDYDMAEFSAVNGLEDSVSNLGPLTFEDCLQHMAQADILVIIQQDTKTQVPSKIYEYMYLKKPILTIAPKDGALGKMIEKYQFGDIFDPRDIDGLSNYLLVKMAEKKEKKSLETEYENRALFDVRQITKKLEKIVFAL